MKGKGDVARNRTDSNDLNHTVEDGRVSVEQTVEEGLLAALLMANADLMEALKQYDDLERIAIERRTEERSRKEVRMERKVCHIFFLQRTHIKFWLLASRYREFGFIRVIGFFKAFYTTVSPAYSPAPKFGSASPRSFSVIGG